MSEFVILGWSGQGKYVFWKNCIIFLAKNIQFFQWGIVVWIGKKSKKKTFTVFSKNVF